MNTVKHLRDLQIATLAAQGMPLCRIAQHLHIHRNTVTQRLKRPETQQLVDALLAELMHRTSAQMAERLEAAHQARQEEKARKRALRQGQGTPVPREDVQFDPHWPIRQALAQHHQVEATLLEQEPDPTFLDAQARDWQARLEELKGMTL
jgi:hypothetical protein